MADTWIGIARLTGAELFATDQSGELTEEQAQASAERYNQMALESIQATFPNADVEMIDGNGLDSVRVIDDHGNEDEVTQAVVWSLEYLSELGTFWQID